MSTAAVTLALELAEQRVTQLSADVHSYALWIVALERAERDHTFDGHPTRAAQTKARREYLTDERYPMLRELVLERLMLRGSKL